MSEPIIMQGFDREAAVPFIAGVMRKEGVKAAPKAMEDFVCRALDADMAYMLENDIIDAEGYMGEGDYDDDDAFEALLDVLSAGQSEAEIDKTAQWLAAYMEGFQAFMAQSGLMEEE